MKRGTGPAFPLAYNYKKEGQEYLDGFTGMDLRAYLAGQAMQGLLSHPNLTYMNSDGTTTKTIEPASVAEFAVKCADALIVELNKEQK